jgi:hypothetical protein
MLLLSVLTAVTLSFATDALASPRVRTRRSVAGVALHLAGVGLLYALVFALTARPWFSALSVVALVGLMAVISNAKYASLREPLVFTDLSLFSQIFAHPRLYLPFLSAANGVGIALGGGLFIAGFLIDTAWVPRSSGIALLTAFVSCGLCIVLSEKLDSRLDLVPADDQRRHGFFAVFIAYLFNGLRPRTLREFRRSVDAGPFAHGMPVNRPDVIVIQSESFFDIRRLGTMIEASLLDHMDAAKRESIQYGELTVPAWGANTMRTEFAMLTGLTEQSLGYARFYPYAFVRRPCASLAACFRRAGYQTTAIHPYAANFFGRARVFRLLQIERFLDIGGFGDAQRCGPYIADHAVAEKIIEQLDSQVDEPVFIFAITMENHGPLHLETVQPGEDVTYHSLGDDPQWRDLTVYLRHLAHADAMVARLIAHLKKRKRKTVLCFYGDHVPALPTVFNALNADPVRSDYFIWRNDPIAPAAQKNLRIDELGQALLQAVDTASTPAHSPDLLCTTI